MHPLQQHTALSSFLHDESFWFLEIKTILILQTKNRKIYIKGMHAYTRAHIYISLYMYTYRYINICIYILRIEWNPHRKSDGGSLLVWLCVVGVVCACVCVCVCERALKTLLEKLICGVSWNCTVVKVKMHSYEATLLKIEHVCMQPVIDKVPPLNHTQLVRYVTKW